ncbi:unnamed protein product, partial [Fusarium fujikuroi]
TLSVPTALAIVALRDIKRIGKDGRATGVQILNAESTRQDNNGAICVWVRPNCSIAGLTTAASRERNPAAYMLLPNLPTKLEPRARNETITTTVTTTPTKTEIMIPKDISQPVISGGPMEELADDIEDIALEI